VNIDTSFQPDKSCQIPGSIFNLNDTNGLQNNNIKQKGKKISKPIKAPIKSSKS
jgi:hypothetical protein